MSAIETSAKSVTNKREGAVGGTVGSLTPMSTIEKQPDLEESEEVVKDPITQEEMPTIVKEKKPRTEKQIQATQNMRAKLQVKKEERALIKQQELEARKREEEEMEAIITAKIVKKAIKVKNKSINLKKEAVKVVEEVQPIVEPVKEVLKKKPVSIPPKPTPTFTILNTKPKGYFSLL